MDWRNLGRRVSSRASIGGKGHTNSRAGSRLDQDWRQLASGNWDEEETLKQAATGQAIYNYRIENKMQVKRNARRPVVHLLSQGLNLGLSLTG